LLLVSGLTALGQGCPDWNAHGHSQTAGWPWPSRRYRHDSSPAQQGTRTQVTGSGGRFVFKFLPPGDYKIDFEISGHEDGDATRRSGRRRPPWPTPRWRRPRRRRSRSSVRPRRSIRLTVHSSTYDSAEVNSAPIGRRIDQVVTLAPNVTDNTPNGGVQIRALSYDNVRLVDGVDINDNLFGPPPTASSSRTRSRRPRS
jgi:hypothetical protein